ncbi:MAG: InlB B-repeat-containing protein [Clostridia bacterium]|nr:InlB B-repeat-containing protein [Clostridia bacterium]
MFRVVQLDGSSRVVTIRIDDFPYGEKLPVPESSEYARSVPEGYYVIGWYTSSQFTTEFDFDAPITRKNTNVYGKLAELKGWCKIDGEWYYYNEDGTKATGFSRVPYNTELGHAPNADDLAYFNANSETSKYTDATTAIYCFGEDGKLLRKTGIVDDKGTVRYAVDGVIAWHVGMVEVDGEYYYFGGDVNGGGNVMLTGNVYATRNTTKLDMVKLGVYTFAEDGKMCKYEGLTEIDGVLYYYEDYCRSKRTGVVKTAEGYIYVRTTNLEVVTDKQYWVSKTAESGVIKGIYVIDENGFIKDPVLVNSEATTGIFDGYYYVDGEVQYAAGAIEIDGDIYYVRTNGQIVAGGEYWVTQSSELLPAGKYTFDNDGKLVK